jgi:hypothetical protein
LEVDLDWEAAYREIKFFNWLALLALAGFGLIFLDPARTMGVILGGLIIIANFGVLQHTVQRALASDKSKMRRKASVIVKYYLRLLVLGTLLFVLIGKEMVDPVGLALGLSTILVSVSAFAVKQACSMYTREAK